MTTASEAAPALAPGERADGRRQAEAASSDATWPRGNPEPSRPANIRVSRFLHHWRHRLGRAVPFLRCRICAAVWAELLSRPGFIAELTKATRDIDEGRWYKWTAHEDGRREFVPNPAWPADGEQPRHGDCL